MWIRIDAALTNGCKHHAFGIFNIFLMMTCLEDKKKISLNIARTIQSANKMY